MTFFSLLVGIALASPQDFVNVRKQDMTLKLHTDKCLLRKEAAEALTRAQSTLNLQSLFLKVHECYRPSSEKPGAKEARGMTVEVTLVSDVGKDLPMNGKQQKILDRAMEKEGFERADKKHFDFRGWKEKPLENFPLGAVP